MPSFKTIGFLVLEEKIFKGFYYFSHGGHLGHVTLIIYITFCPPFLRMALIGLGVSKKKSLKSVNEDDDDGRRRMGILYAHCEPSAAQSELTRNSNQHNFLNFRWI